MMQAVQTVSELRDVQAVRGGKSSAQADSPGAGAEGVGAADDTSFVSVLESAAEADSAVRSADSYAEHRPEAVHDTAAFSLSGGVSSAASFTDNITDILTLLNTPAAVEAGVDTGLESAELSVESLLADEVAVSSEDIAWLLEAEGKGAEPESETADISFDELPDASLLRTDAALVQAEQDADTENLESARVELAADDAARGTAKQKKKASAAEDVVPGEQAGIIFAQAEHKSIEKPESFSDAPLRESGKKKDVHAAVIEVRDERTAAAAGESPVKDVTFGADGSAEMSITLADRTPSEKALDVSFRSSEGKQTFASYLSDELQNRAGDLVKTGSIILRDNNTGTIKLTVHPEQLGDVKIHLELADKIITGKIVVSSEEAFNAFRDNLQGLKDAFTAGGFESAGFELSWAGNGSGERQNQENRRAPFYAALVPAADAEGGFFSESPRGGGYGSRSAIDMLA